jgi:hypothetical protein
MGNTLLLRCIIPNSYQPAINQVSSKILLRVVVMSQDAPQILDTMSKPSTVFQVQLKNPKQRKIVLIDKANAHLEGAFEGQGGQLGENQCGSCGVWGFIQ